jgi:hypothetical protein
MLIEKQTTEPAPLAAPKSIDEDNSDTPRPSLNIRQTTEGEEES